ncbi:MAG: histone deacetylase [Proteobacteria bacterium]|nr:histone deacetylase [Pseudomonadota bacterium]
MITHHSNHHSTPAAGLPSQRQQALSAPSLERRGKVPIVFHPSYDIAFSDITSAHPFEFKKRGTIYSELKREIGLSPGTTYTPERANDHLLGLVHDSTYLSSLGTPKQAARVMGLPDLASFSMERISKGLLDPLRYAVSGTVLAAQLAMEHRWAINLSGGFHHAKANRAEGFCFFADAAIAVRALQLENPQFKVLSVDLDAHQGNGVALLLGEDPNVCLFDIYNRDIYPQEPEAAQRIKYNLPVPSSITDAEYLGLLQARLPEALDNFQAHMILYNAGSDIFIEDRLGRMRISEGSIYERDAFVFSEAFRRNIPIVMLLSGGYSSRSPQLIAGSILHMLRRHMADEIEERLSNPYR